MPTIEKLENMSRWFFGLSQSAHQVGKAYQRAAREMSKASKATAKAIKASREAHNAAAAIISDGSSNEIPTDIEAQKKNFQEWLDFLQNDPDLIGETSTDEE